MTDDRSYPTVDWAMLADYAMVDSSGKLSVVGIFDRLWAATVPTLHPLLFVVARWKGPPLGLVTVELSVWGPSKDLVVSGTQSAQLAPDGSASGIFRLSPLPLASFGEYIVELVSGGESAAHLALTVEQADQQ